MNARRRLANRPVRFAATIFGIVTVAAMGCGDQFGHMAVGPTSIKAFPNGQITRTSTATPVAIATAIPIEVLERRTSMLVELRSSLRSGAIDVVAIADGEERSRRRVERIGENLILIFIPSSSGATLDLVQVANAGPLDVEIKRASFYELEPDFARDVAADAAADFEAETGQLADPLVENLVPNASFATDDEVRGTPADWFAYVETSTNVLERRLRVWGTAPGRRPYVATGPMRVEAGRRYRILVRLTVRDGAVALRVADYEELRVLVDLGSVSAADGPVERRVDFTASDADRAARIRFEPATPGVPADFEITAIQMELLP